MLAHLIDVLADSGERNDIGHMWNNGWGTGWGSGWMMLVWVAILALIAWGIVAVTRSTGRARDNARGPASPTPRQILDRHYAAGEINQSEYLHARSRLDDHGPSGG